MLIFKSKQKKFEGDLKIKLCGRKLDLTESVKYLNVEIDTNFSCQYYVNDLSIELNRGNTPLFKMRKCVSFKTLRSTYFAVFGSAHSAALSVWAKNCSTGF